MRGWVISVAVVVALCAGAYGVGLVVDGSSDSLYEKCTKLARADLQTTTGGWSGGAGGTRSGTKSAPAVQRVSERIDPARHAPGVTFDSRGDWI